MLQDGSGLITDYCDMNKFVDTILGVVFKHHSGRRIVFSSFDPDICSMYVSAVLPIVLFVSSPELKVQDELLR